MASHLTVVTRKGQVTIPIEIRRALDLKEGDRVAVSLENGHVRLVPQGSVVERTAGIVKGRGPVLTAEELRVAAEQAIADVAVERMGDGEPSAAATREVDQTRIAPAPSIVARTAGALRGGRRRLPAEEERAAFERAVAEEVAASMER